MLSPLREHLHVVERFMCQDEWEKISLGSVPSRAFHLNKTAFQRHTPAKFAAFMQRVAKGKDKINVAAIHPHELVRRYYDNPTGRTIHSVSQ